MKTFSNGKSPKDKPLKKIWIILHNVCSSHSKIHLLLLYEAHTINTEKKQQNMTLAAQLKTIIEFI